MADDGSGHVDKSGRLEHHPFRSFDLPLSEPPTNQMVRWAWTVAATLSRSDTRRRSSVNVQRPLSPARVVVVLPAFNEERTVGETIEAFHSAIPEAAIIVVNNNSSDATERVANETLGRLGATGCVLNERAQGKGNAVRRAFLDVDADIFVLADADLTYPADRVRDLIAPVAAGDADMVVGDRHSGGHYGAENKRRFHGFGNNLVQRLVNGLFGAKLVDIMSGYRVFSRSFVKMYPVLVEGFQVETDLTLHALHRRYRVVEVPVEYKDRPSGSHSKLSTFSDGAKVLFTIAQILRYYRPLAFFGGVGALFSLLALVAGTPVITDWIRHRWIYHVPLAILATGLSIVALVAVGIGLILDAIAHNDKAMFERQLLSRSGGELGRSSVAAHHAHRDSAPRA